MSLTRPISFTQGPVHAGRLASSWMRSAIKRSFTATRPGQLVIAVVFVCVFVACLSMVTRSELESSPMQPVSVANPEAMSQAIALSQPLVSSRNAPSGSIPTGSNTRSLLGGGRVSGPPGVDRTHDNSPDLSPVDTAATAEPVITRMSFSPSGRLLAVASYYGESQIFGTREPRVEIHVFDLETLDEIQLLRVPFEFAVDVGTGCTYCGSIAFSPDESSLALVAIDGSVGLWRISDGHEIFKHWGPWRGGYAAQSLVNDFAFDLQFTADGSVLGVLANGAMDVLYRAADGTRIEFERPPTFLTNSFPVRYSPMAATSSDLTNVLGIMVKTSGLSIVHTRNWDEWAKVVNFGGSGGSVLAYSQELSLAVTGTGPSLPIEWRQSVPSFQIWQWDGPQANVQRNVAFPASVDSYPAGYQGASISSEGTTVALHALYGDQTSYTQQRFSPTVVNLEILDAGTLTPMGSLSLRVSGGERPGSNTGGGRTGGIPYSVSPNGLAIAHAVSGTEVQITRLPDGARISTISVPRESSTP